MVLYIITVQISILVAFFVVKKRFRCTITNKASKCIKLKSTFGAVCSFIVWRKSQEMR